MNEERVADLLERLRAGIAGGNLDMLEALAFALRQLALQRIALLLLRNRVEDLEFQMDNVNFNITEDRAVVRLRLRPSGADEHIQQQ